MATTIVPKPEQETKSFDSTLASAQSTMIFSEVISLAVDSFRASKARFMLTMLGMVIGSASIILVVTVGMTGRDYAIATISSLGPNKIEMQYSGGSIIGSDNASSPDYMTREDMVAVATSVPGVVAYSPMLEVHDRISLGGGITKDAMLLGVSPKYKEIRGLVVLAGRFFDAQDAAAHAKVAVLNEPLADELYGSPQAAVDQNITIRTIPLRIIGQRLREDHLRREGAQHLIKPLDLHSTRRPRIRLPAVLDLAALGERAVQLLLVRSRLITQAARQ
jgi:putative ABC transport system permease protein